MLKGCIGSEAESTAWRFCSVVGLAHDEFMVNGRMNLGPLAISEHIVAGK